MFRFSLCRQQSELVDLAESIQEKLSYFNELENINTVMPFPKRVRHVFVICLLIGSPPVETQLDDAIGEQRGIHSDAFQIR